MTCAEFDQHQNSSQRRRDRADLSGNPCNLFVSLIIRMKPSNAYDDYPYCGRFVDDHAHAPYVIARSLMQLGLGDRTAQLLDWLGRFDGLEEHLGEGFEPDYRLDPVRCVRDVLFSHVLRYPALDEDTRLTQEQRHERIEAVVADFQALEFVGVMANWHGKKRSWNPLGEDWLSFIEFGPDLPALQQMDDKDGHGLVDIRISAPAARSHTHVIRRILLGQDRTEQA